MPDTIPVRFRDCACPGTPHPDGDIAELRPYLDYAGGAEALAALREVADEPNRLGEVLGPIFIRRGVVAWNLVNEDDDPVPLHPALEELRWEDAYELADKADDIYGGQVLAPLQKRMAASTKNGQTGGSTSRPRRRSPRTLTPSEPSS